MKLYGLKTYVGVTFIFPFRKIERFSDSKDLSKRFQFQNIFVEK